MINNTCNGYALTRKDAVIFCFMSITNKFKNYLKGIP